MPELPDLTVYLEALEPRVLGEPLERVRLASISLLRSVDPPLAAFTGKRVTGLRRLGKRLVFGFEDELFLVLHLMIAGRLRWKERGAKLPGRIGHAAFDFPKGTLILTEAGTKKRASLFALRGEAALAEHDPGGLEVMAASPAEFAAALRRESHTLKRALTDPHLLAGIGNAYSDEILHRARLSPVALSQRLDRRGAGASPRRHASRRCASGSSGCAPRRATGFPEKVTAFRPRDGGARALPPALPRLRRPRAAHRARRERDELLRALPDGRQAPRRPRALAAPQGGLAAHARGARGAARRGCSDMNRGGAEDEELPAAFLAQLADLARSYLATDDPLLQSGFGGGAERWRAEREPILDAVTDGGAFLDVGCANGFLLECLVAWAAERGVALEPWGVEQSAELVALARARLPSHASRLFVGNAWSWQPPRRFRYVYCLLDVVPESHLRTYVARLLERVVEPGGVLVLGSYGSCSRSVPPIDVAGVLTAFGYTVAGESSGGAGPVTRFAWL